MNDSQQVFQIVEAPSFVTLFTWNRVESSNFVKVTEKRAAESELSDSYFRGVSHCLIRVGSGNNFM